MLFLVQSKCYVTALPYNLNPIKDWLIKFTFIIELKKSKESSLSITLIN